MGWRMVFLFPGRSGAKNDASVSCPHAAHTRVAVAKAARGSFGWTPIRPLGHGLNPRCGDIGEPEYRRAPRPAHLSSDGDSCLVCF